jgi:hypothetical protein
MCTLNSAAHYLKAQLIFNACVKNICFIFKQEVDSKHEPESFGILSYFEKKIVYLRSSSTT